jgi:uncharacterized membrane protein
VRAQLRARIHLVSAMLVASAALAAVAATGLAGPAAADEPEAPHTREPRGRFEPRVVPELDELDRPGARSRHMPVGLPDGSLLLDRGVYRRLPDVPGALQTTHSRDNNHGQTVGVYVELDASGAPRVHGFLMRGRHVTTIDVPGAVVTNPLGVNDRGQVVGSWVGPDATPDPVFGQLKPAHGFVWERGHVKTFDVPGAITTAGYEINNRGWIVGNYDDANRVTHGYVLRDGRFTTIDHPRTPGKPDVPGTRVVGIDDRGRLVGSYGDENGLLHAWAWGKGRFTDVEPPGALQSEASQINDRGQIVGRYLDARPKLVSFAYERGRYTRIEAPGRCDTAAFGLNDRGQVVISTPGTSAGSTCPPPGGDS